MAAAAPAAPGSATSRLGDAIDASVGPGRHAGATGDASGGAAARPNAEAPPPAGGGTTAIAQAPVEAGHAAGPNAPRPAGPSLPALPTPPAGPLHAVAATVQLATTRGFSHARLALNPPELGGVEVLLRSSSAGIVATLTADSPAAARLLEAGAGDLRRQLEGQGIELQRLEVDVTDRDATGDGAAAGAQAGDGGRETTARRASGDEAGRADRDRHADDGTAGAADSRATRIDLGDGFLIDVVA